MWRQIDLTDNKCLSLSRGGFGVRNSELCLFVEECKNYRKQEKVQQCQCAMCFFAQIWIIYLNYFWGIKHQLMTIISVTIINRNPTVKHLPMRKQTVTARRKDSILLGINHVCIYF